MVDIGECSKINARTNSRDTISGTGGCDVGTNVGSGVRAVGTGVVTVGFADCVSVGAIEGATVGLAEVASVSAIEGASVGLAEVASVSAIEGDEVGAKEGSFVVGDFVGESVTLVSLDALTVGIHVGNSDVGGDVGFGEFSSANAVPSSNKALTQMSVVSSKVPEQPGINASSGSLCQQIRSPSHSSSVSQSPDRILNKREFLVQKQKHSLNECKIDRTHTLTKFQWENLRR